MDWREKKKILDYATGEMECVTRLVNAIHYIENLDWRSIDAHRGNVCVSLNCISH